MTSIYSAQDLARELWHVACFDEDASIPASVLLRIAGRESLDLEVCPTCGRFDGEHVDGCELDKCRICVKRPSACNCDADSEREMGK